MQNKDHYKDMGLTEEVTHQDGGSYNQLVLYRFINSKPDKRMNDYLESTQNI